MNSPWSDSHPKRFKAPAPPLVLVLIAAMLNATLFLHLVGQFAGSR